MEMKYIIIDNLYAIIFPTQLSHLDVVNNYNVTSAGFIDKEGKIYGFSDTLNLHSNSKDQKIIDKILKVK